MDRVTSTKTNLVPIMEQFLSFHQQLQNRSDVGNKMSLVGVITV
jgi:hypothetical protein